MRGVLHAEIRHSNVMQVVKSVAKKCRLNYRPFVVYRLQYVNGAEYHGLAVGKGTER